jgi:hypothetical protein
MAPNIGGSSASPQPEPSQPTVTNRREIPYEDFSDDEEIPNAASVEAVMPVPPTNGTLVPIGTFKTTMARAAAGGLLDDNAELAAAALDTVSGIGEQEVEILEEIIMDDALAAARFPPAAELPLDMDMDVDVDLDDAIVPETQDTAAASKPNKHTGTKSASATPNPAKKRGSAKNPAASTTKPKTKAAPKSKKDEGPKVEFAGETGLDTSVEVNGEKEWEIERIAGAENDGKTLLVKWKGWKGFWEEDRDNLAASAPGLVEAFEKAQRAGKKSAAAKSKTPAAKAPKGQRGRPAKKSSTADVLKPKTKGAKVEKKRKAPATKTKAVKPPTTTVAKKSTGAANAKKAAASKTPAEKKKPGRKPRAEIPEPDPAAAAKATPKSPAMGKVTTKSPAQARATPKKSPAKAKAAGSGAGAAGKATKGAPGKQTSATGAGVKKPAAASGKTRGRPKRG